MITYVIDENMPFLPFWDPINFAHVKDIPFIKSDTDIWDYAFQNQLTIITKDTDCYYRYLSSKKESENCLDKNREFEEKFLYSLY